MFKLPLITSGCTVPLQKFWDAVMVYHNRPQLVNKKLSGVIEAHFYKVDFTNIQNILEHLTHAALIYEIRKLVFLTKDSLSNLITDILLVYDKNFTISETNFERFKENQSGLFISVRILIPKNSAFKKTVEIVVLDKMLNIATFFAIIEQNDIIIAPRFPYHLELTSSGHMRCVVDNFDDAETPSAEWIVESLFVKLVKWSNDIIINQPQDALQLIPIDKYADLYQKLKEKYGAKMVKIWPENTDPLKFVYEDIAIASYLICLWGEIHDYKPSFVDLGCGNGLLVYILSEEGYPGFGVDVRRRKIWDLYPETTKLEERTITPSSSSLFPDTDWIIGNHSDELTPWIPVIASRSSYRTNFFLLPCCSYDFSGKKYSRVNTAKSVYNEYMEYIQNISSRCGFNTKIDKMKIPSTKRTCLVSYNRTYPIENFNEVDRKLTEFIHSRSQANKGDEKNWLGDFQARPNVEKVRNCTKLDRNLVNSVILRIVGRLLEESVEVDGVNGGWNAGRKLKIAEIIKDIPKDDLKQLKNECGGLQTLMRNHRYIFVVEGGCVQLRVPKTYEEVQKYKEKQCWFFANHPDGCLHSASNCCYKHGV